MHSPASHFSDFCAAEQHGGHHAGTSGDFGILSFSFPKNVTSFYGGCVVTNNDNIALRVRRAVDCYPDVDKNWLYRQVVDCAIKDIGTWGPIRQLASLIIRYGYIHNIQGIVDLVSFRHNPALLENIPRVYRTKISPQQARAIADKWPDIEEDVLHRINCAKIYCKQFEGIQDIVFPEFSGDKSNNYLFFPIQVRDKFALQHYMIEHYCDVAVQVAPNCADLPGYKRYFRDCPCARSSYSGSLLLPTYRGFPLAKAQQYARIVRSYFNA
jgi:dTDP-4-amino-4,6-dideoxygalactose transaminase